MIAKDAQRSNLEQLYRKARTLESSGNYAAALDIYRQLWDQRPGDMSHYRGIKECLFELNRVDEAIQIINEMKSMNKSYHLDADLGVAHYLKGDKDLAMEIWYTVLNKNKNNRGAYQAVANSMIRYKLFEEAVDVYQYALKNIRSHSSSFLLDLAHLYNMRLDYREATQLYVEYLVREPAQYAYIERQISRLAKDIEEPELIIKIIKRKQGEMGKPPVLSRLLAGLHMQNADYKNALDEYTALDRKLNEKDESGKLLFNFALAALKDGENRYSEEAFRRFLRLYPGSEYIARARNGLAEAAFQRGNFDESLKQYKKIVSEHGAEVQTKEASLRLGQIYLEQFNQPDSAKKAFLGITRDRSRGDVYFEALYYIGECDIVRGDLKSAGGWYEKAVENKSCPDKIIERARYRLALIDIWEGQFDAASKRLTDIIETSSFSRRERRGFLVNDALSLSLFLKEHGESEEMLSAYTRQMLLMEQGRYDMALKGLRDMQQGAAGNSMGDVILMSIADLEHRSGHYEMAIATYRNLLKTYPESEYNDNAQNRIAEIFEKDLNDPDTAITEYETVLVEHPQSMLLEDVRQRIRRLEKRLKED
jgi:tetratricopeptide (TPR) repeat protein